ncbi:Ger(x)C family spore germination protein [Paenibacillus sp. HJGM_3]|uniref:Ger(x)C family spore germination protein n=1 Tax=Paenibacillus sp. HJGM_3 TaxID=3379816 RepID=UPI00385827DA
MRRWVLGVLFIMMTVGATGCADRISVEDMTLSLLVGIDLDDQDQLVVSVSSPVFSKEAKDREEEMIVRSITLRQSREELDRGVVGRTIGGKTQAILIGKRVLQQQDWFKLLDPYYRDVKNTAQPTIIAVDGTVSDIITFAPPDKPRLPVYLTKLIQTAHLRNITVRTTLQDLHRQMFEKGITPSITELRKDSGLKVMGTALLKEDGRYALSLDPNENKLLAILGHENKGEFPFTVHLPSRPNVQKFSYDTISFSAPDITTKTKVHYANGKFSFDVRAKMRIVLTERAFPLDVETEVAPFQEELARELENQFQLLIKKIQTARIDPVGFGLYARAQQYKHWKAVQDDWGEALARANVNVHVDVKVLGLGAVK